MGRQYYNGSSRNGMGWDGMGWMDGIGIDGGLL